MSKCRELQAPSKISKYSESDLPPSGNVPLDDFSQSLDLHRSECCQIPHRHFKIEGESYMCTQLNLDEPTSYEEALTSPK